MMMLAVASECLRHKPLAAIFTATMATYSKSRPPAKQYGRRIKLASPSGPRQHISESFKEMEEMSEAQDDLNFDRKDFVHKSFREEEKMRKKILYKIIGHKYFRPPQALNLLTWDAKEQIRYLHAEYPDEWTIDRLAESFPVDRGGVINIIKSKFGPRSIGDVIRHDRRVKEHWVSLNAGNSGKEGGPVTLRFEKILDEVRLKLLGNAAGIESLPMPEIGRFLSAGKDAGIARHERMPGPFESIVKGYCDDRRAKQVLTDGDKTLQSKELLKENRETNQNLLESVARSTQHLVGKTSGHEHRALVTRDNTQKRKSVNKGLGKFDFVDENLQTSVSDPHHSSKDKRIQTLLDAEFPDFNAEPPRRSLRRRGTVGASRHDIDAEHTTGIVRTDDHETLSQPTEFEDGDFARKKQYAPKPIDERDIIKQIRYDVPRELQSNHQEAYLYDERKGYQHPLGKAARDIPERIDVPKDSSQGSERVYRQGKNYYDSNGEFLYRVP